MSTYFAPVQDMQFVLQELAGLEEISRLQGYEEATPDLVDAVLEEAARLAGEVLSPINKTGDLQGTRVEDGRVIVADGFAAAYAQFTEGGWPGLQFSQEYEGQGLPAVLQMAVSEMCQSANLAFSLVPLLTQGAIEALELHGDARLKQVYLPKMVSGEWTGTMDLTEPQAGSDLAAVRTKAVPAEGCYRITGQKIFITFGDHEMTENVIHLVLARTPNAPEGVKGISLFVVPKYLVNDDGFRGKRNHVRALSVEHKLGVHASPTCVMSFGDEEGAVGYLVGEENQGLMYMFTMMNNARMNVGLQGVAIAERAYQQARDYARERVQGNAPGHDGRVTIIKHPDVRRMLLLMRSQVEAGRALAYTAMACADLARKSEDAQVRAQYQTRVELLTPIVKGWCSEMAQEVATLGVQIHGGMGYVEETGAAQHYRDARITTIYEGTTGIQALDLIGRKLLRDKGAGVRSLLDEIGQLQAGLEGADEDLTVIRDALKEASDAANEAVQWILENGTSDPNTPGAVAVSYLMLMGTVCGMWQMARAALVATRKLRAGEGDAGFYRTKLLMARFYAEQVSPRAQSYKQALKAGESTLMRLSEEQF